MRVRALLLIGALALVTAAKAPPAPPPSREPAIVRVRLVTGAGPIVIALDARHAPATVANFLAYVDDGRFEGTSFYRAMKLGAADAPPSGLIQGGTRNDPKRVLPPVVHEPTSATGLTHDDGAISMARYAPGSATGDFFIIVGEMRGLDAQPGGMGDTAGFAVFGRVAEGMDVVRRILVAPTSLTEGDGVMRGQMLAAPVKIITARRVP